MSKDTAIPVLNPPGQTATDLPKVKRFVITDRNAKRVTIFGREKFKDVKKRDQTYDAYIFTEAALSEVLVIEFADILGKKQVMEVSADQITLPVYNAKALHIRAKQHTDKSPLNHVITVFWVPTPKTQTVRNVLLPFRKTMYHSHRYDLLAHNRHWHRATFFVSGIEGDFTALEHTDPANPTQHGPTRLQAGKFYQTGKISTLAVQVEEDKARPQRPLTMDIVGIFQLLAVT